MKFIFQQWLGPYNDFWKVWQVCFNLNFCRLSYFRRSQWLKNTFSVAAAKTRYTAILDPWKIYSSDQECTIIEVVIFIGHNFCRRSQFMQKIRCSCQLKSVWTSGYSWSMKNKFIRFKIYFHSSIYLYRFSFFCQRKVNVKWIYDQNVNYVRRVLIIFRAKLFWKLL